MKNIIEKEIVPFRKWDSFIKEEIELIIEDLHKIQNNLGYHKKSTDIKFEYCNIMLEKLNAIKKELNYDLEKINQEAIITIFNGITGVHYDLRVNINELNKQSIIFISNTSGKIVLLEKMVRFFFEGKNTKLEKKVSYVTKV